MAALTSSYFLTQTKLRGSLPTGRFTDAEILEVANDVMLSQVAPLIISLREEYFLTSETTPILEAQAEYDVPYRAMGQALREIKKVDGSSLIDLPRISPESITTLGQGEPSSFYLQAGSVVLSPTPSSTSGALLKMWYFKTPNKIVEVSDCGIITGIDTLTGILTASCPSTWSAGNEIDLISRRNGHKCLSTDITLTSIDPTTVGIAAASIPSTLGIGDYVALAGESPFLEVPDVCFDLTVRLTVNELLDSMGDQAAYQAGLVKAEALKQNVVGLLTNRVQGALKRSVIKLI